MTNLKKWSTAFCGLHHMWRCCGRCIVLVWVGHCWRRKGKRKGRVGEVKKNKVDKGWKEQWRKGRRRGCNVGRRFGSRLPVTTFPQGNASCKINPKMPLRTNQGRGQRISLIPSRGRSNRLPCRWPHMPSPRLSRLPLIGQTANYRPYAPPSLNQLSYINTSYVHTYIHFFIPLLL